MPTTINNTLPLSWDSSYIYTTGDRVSCNGIIYKSLQPGNENHLPPKSPQFWEPLDIYKKDLTNMPHGPYDGDDSFWERDNIYIDSNGWVYINNEITGINVRGRDGSSIVKFEDLTPEQIEQLRGDTGPQGEPGPQGPQGEQGPIGQVILTPEQIEELKGDQGKSTYDIWKENGHPEGSEQDFLNWLTEQSVILDKKLLPNSINPVTNKAIYDALFAYQIYMNTLMQDYQRRLIELENRLKYEYNGEEHEFKFGVTNNGSYGYIKKNESQVIPFDNVEREVLQSTAALTSTLIMASQYSTHEATPVNITVGNWDGEVEHTSLIDDPAEPTGIDAGNAIYGSGVVPTSFEDYADTKYYLYRNGRYIGFVIGGYSLYGMTEQSAYIQSDNESDIEGFLTSVDLGAFGHTLGIKIAPLTEGDEISYQIGQGNANCVLPDVVNGTNRINYLNGTFNTETTLRFDILQGNIPYFASTSRAQFKIIEIFVE